MRPLDNVAIEHITIEQSLKCISIMIRVRGVDLFPSHLGWTFFPEQFREGVPFSHQKSWKRYPIHIENELKKLFYNSKIYRPISQIMNMELIQVTAHIYRSTYSMRCQICFFILGGHCSPCWYMYVFSWIYFLYFHSISCIFHFDYKCVK